MHPDLASSLQPSLSLGVEGEELACLAVYLSVG